jgi:class 3 adenylate cyclase
MAEYANRTFICSVLFLDIVDYSICKVAEQIKLKERFNAVVSEAISNVPTDDRVILDTGDGAALSFLGDPEDAMFAGLSLRDALAGHETTAGPRLQVRVGINLGPVRLVKDINGNPNIIGDGINVAQRVMSFGEPGQILVSRSYYDIMVRLSESYTNLFRYQGAKTDKHVREHEVYAVSTATSSLRRASPGPVLKIRGSLANLHPRRWAGALALNSKLFIVAPLAFVFIVGTGVMARGYRNVGDKSKPFLVKAPMQQAATPTAASPPAKALEPNAAASVKEPEAPVETTEPVKTTDTAALSKPKQAERPAVAQAQHPDGALNIIALPWAEVYVDGKMHGVSPPLRSIQLAPGKHRIELRNSSFQAHAVTITVKPGERVYVRHSFRS